VQEASFKEFCERPENKMQMVKHQQSEMRKAQRLQRKMQAMVSVHCFSAAVTPSTFREHSEHANEHLGNIQGFSSNIQGISSVLALIDVFVYSTDWS
jgi:hypothetical protein